MSISFLPSRRLGGLVIAAVILAVPNATLSAQAAAGRTTPAGMAAIREADLKRDLYAMAGDAMRGREAGTVDEMRASIWVAEQLRSIGVKPAGVDGSYLQWFNMRRTRISTVSSSVRVGGQSVALWSDIVPNGMFGVRVTAPTVVLADATDSTTDVRGKVVVTNMLPPANAVRPDGTNSFEYRYATSALANTGSRLTRRGAAAVIVIADSIAEIGFEGVAAIRSRGTYDVENAAARFATQVGGGAVGGTANNAVAPPAPVLLARQRVAARLRVPGQEAEIEVRIERFDTPSTNIVGVIRGTDPALRDEYVLFSSHQDHDGVRFTIDGDSVWAGADDNGTVSVALLAIARAFVRQPARRSILFVYHGAEERGLLGSRYHAGNPVVPLEKIVTVLNGDMIGRNHPDSASLMGVQPPHRNSSELVAMALEANRRTGKFVLDSLWDRPTHPEGWYFRSDHVPYARLNVPALFFSTNLHRDYHTPRDKPSAIDYAKLTRMTQWMYLTGWTVASTTKRPGIDAGFRLER